MQELLDLFFYTKISTENKFLSETLSGYFSRISHLWTAFYSRQVRNTAIPFSINVLKGIYITTLSNTVNGINISILETQEVYISKWGVIILVTWNFSLAFTLHSVGCVKLGIENNLGC